MAQESHGVLASDGKTVIMMATIPAAADMVVLVLSRAAVFGGDKNTEGMVYLGRRSAEAGTFADFSLYGPAGQYMRHEFGGPWQFLGAHGSADVNLLRPEEFEYDVTHDDADTGAYGTRVTVRVKAS